MLRELGAAIYRGLFWTYERGTWQYDIMVILILAFIFLTPREWFGDRPPSESERPALVLISSGPHQKVYQLRASLLHAEAGQSLEQEAQRVMTQLTGKPVHITEVKPERDAQGKVISYAVMVQE